MSTTEIINEQPTESVTVTQHHRPLYIRRVPELTWIKVHENALRSRMRLQDYLVQLMEQSQPLLRAAVERKAPSPQ